MPAKKKIEKRIALPKSVSRADEVRAQLTQLGIDEQAVFSALAAARQGVAEFWESGEEEAGALLASAKPQKRDKVLHRQSYPE